MKPGIRPAVSQNKVGVTPARTRWLLFAKFSLESAALRLSDVTLVSIGWPVEFHRPGGAGASLWAVFSCSRLARFSGQIETVCGSPVTGVVDGWDWPWWASPGSTSRQLIERRRVHRALHSLARITPTGVDELNGVGREHHRLSISYLDGAKENPRFTHAHRQGAGQLRSCGPPPPCPKRNDPYCSCPNERPVPPRDNAIEAERHRINPTGFEGRVPLWTTRISGRVPVGVTAHVLRLHMEHAT